MDSFGSVEIKMLWLSVVLGLGQLVLTTLFSVGTRGLPWGMSVRDEPAPPLGKIGARSERAFRNFIETFVFFLGAVAIASHLGKLGAWTALGAQIYFWSRLAYVPAYLFAIPVLRTALWTASLAGIALVLIYGVWPQA
ncbi:MAG: MAPEG family protein [Rhizomicrobium sp.]